MPTQTMVNTKMNMAAVAARAEIVILAPLSRTPHSAQQVSRKYGGPNRPPYQGQAKTPAQLVTAESAAPTALNVALRSVPTVVTATMITTAINAAMRPYSMAVTP